MRHPSTRSSTRQSRLSLGGFSDPSVSSEDEDLAASSSAFYVDQNGSAGDTSFNGSLFPMSPELTAVEEVGIQRGDERG